jgi:hypothetical protein
MTSVHIEGDLRGWARPWVFRVVVHFGLTKRVLNVVSLQTLIYFVCVTRLHGKDVWKANGEVIAPMAIVKIYLIVTQNFRVVSVLIEVVDLVGDERW